MKNSGLLVRSAVIASLWGKLMVPETKGIPLEEIQRQFGIAR